MQTFEWRNWRTKKKKRCLQTDIDSLTTSADKYAKKAEKTHQMSWITKSNSFRSANQKSTEMKAVDEQLNQKLQDRKNSEWIRVRLVKYL